MFQSTIKNSQKDEKEFIRIKGGTMMTRIVIASGKEGDYFVVVSPALMVSGYGTTEIEAKKSFDENMETFCSDFMKLSTDKRFAELKKLGFVRERLHTKNFSKAYIDKNGVVQGIEPETLKINTLEAVI